VLIIKVVSVTYRYLRKNLYFADYETNLL